MSRLRIASWPYLSDTNKFIQTLLGVSTHEVEISAVQNLRMIEPDRGTDIFLIHWPEFVFHHYGAAGSFMEARFALRKLQEWKNAGAKLVWMVHDLDPHDLTGERRLVWRKFFRPRLARLVDAVITLSPSTLEILKKEIPEVADKPATFIWHPVYSGIAPSVDQRKSARMAAGLQDADKLVASIGFLGRYKGLDELTAVFSSSPDPDWRLLLAGAPKSQGAGFVRELQRFARKDKRITVQPRRLSAQELHLVTYAADLVVAPFRKYLHSGSILHALSARVPVLTPDSPFARDMQSHFPPGWLHLYEPPLTAEWIERALQWSGRLVEPMPEALAPARCREKLMSFFRKLAGIGEPPARRPASGTIVRSEAPLFSFTLVNRNYGRFIGEAIDSIRGQDYPNFECIVVDDGSTDDSPSVIRRHAAADSRFRLELLDRNIGQLHGALHALQFARGEYISMMDSDDCLLPSFASTHVQAHIAAPVPVGVTSSGTFLISSESTIVAGNDLCISENALSVPIERAQLHADRLEWIDAGDHEYLLGQLRLCERSLGGWIWSPGTSNVYSRAAVELGLRTLRRMKIEPGYATDNHFLRIGHLPHGTIAIDIPLSLYRTHDANKSVSMTRLQQFGRNALHPRDRLETAKTRHAAVLVRDRKTLAPEVSPSRLWTSLELVIQPLPDQIHEYFGSEDLFPAFAEEYGSLREDFGEADLMWQLARCMGASGILKLARAQPNFRDRLRVRTALAREIVRRRILRMSGQGAWWR